MQLEHTSFLVTLSGIAFFMFGMQLASDSLQKLMANRMRDLMAALSSNKLYGVGAGVGLTLMIQSSGAVTSMLVGLGSAGVVTLSQVMSVILGTTIGTTFTVQLLSLNVAQYGLAIFAVTFFIGFVSKTNTIKNLMNVFMGFGLIFFGLDMISQGTLVLKNLDYFTESLVFLKANPLVSIVITSLFTAVVHSSAVTIGFAMSLASSGMIDMETAIYWVYGANIGTTGTALLAAVGGNYIGRQVAWAHAFYKLLSVLIFYYFTAEFSQLIISDSPARDVANAHTVFNILAAVVFFPFINFGTKVIEKLFPPSNSEKQFGPKYVNRGNLDSAPVALAHAEREILRMGDIVSSMVKDSLDLFKNEDEDLMESIRERDNKVDLLNKEINLYVANQLEGSSGGISKQLVKVISYADELESAADVIDNTILDLAQKKHNLKLEFSEDGWSDLHEIYGEVCKMVPLSLSCYQVNDAKLAQRIVDLKRSIRKQEYNMRKTHIIRLAKGNKNTINTSAIHLDLLMAYRRISGLLSSHVYSFLKDSQ